MGVKNANTKLYTSFWGTSQTIPTWPSKNLFYNTPFWVKRTSTTSILSQNNKACNGTNELVKIVISLNCVISFFHVECKQPTTAKMYKIFIAKKSCCANRESLTILLLMHAYQIASSTSCWRVREASWQALAWRATICHTYTPAATCLSSSTPDGG